MRQTSGKDLITAGSTGNSLLGKIGAIIGASRNRVEENLDWLRQEMHPYFFSAMQEEPAAIAALATGLQGLAENRRLQLADREKGLILACLNHPGSLYDTLRTLPEREVSFAYFAHSRAKVPGLARELEIQRFEFDRKSNAEIVAAGEPEIPARLRREVMQALKAKDPGLNLKAMDRLLGILWLNNENYLRLSPVHRVAQLVWLFARGSASGGLFLDVEEADRRIAGVLRGRQSAAKGFPAADHGGLQPVGGRRAPRLLPHHNQRHPPLFPRHLLRQEA